MVAPIVTIEKLAFGGAGFGRWEGKACFVPFTAPGDVVRIDVVTEKRSFINGQVREFVQHSPVRVSPSCQVFGSCGGCQWQHVPYDLQVEQKYEIFAGLMGRIARVNADRIEPVVPSPDPFGYRSRIQLKVRYAAGEVHIGFYRAGSHFVIDIPQCCPISAPVVNSVIKDLHSFMAVFPEPDKIPQIDISAGADGRTIIIFHYIGSNPDDICSFIGENRTSLGSASGLWLQCGKKHTLVPIAGIGALTYRVPAGGGGASPSLELRFSRGGFSQVNYRQNEILVGTVLEWAALNGTERVLDLYCGNGNISLPLARNAGRVVGVEEYAPSLTDAGENCRIHGIGNCEFNCSDVTRWLEKAVASGDRFDVVVLDPPRAGAKEAIPLIARLRPRAILYISCDPATLARDVATLVKHGFDCAKSRPVDMFPQTYHLESITLLEPI